MLRSSLLHRLKQFRLDRCVALPSLAIPKWTPVSCISSSSHVFGKIFHDGENKYAHQILENSLRKYQLFKPLRVETSAVGTLPESILDPPNISECQPDQVFEDFKSLMIYCRDSDESVSDDRFTKYVDLFCQVCTRFTDKQLADCLAYLRLHPPTSSTRTKNFCEIWNALDFACLKRVDSWSVNQALYICDAWYQLGVARISEYVRSALRKVGRRVTKMTPEEMLHSMFFCNIVRRPLVEMFDYEVNLERLIDEMTIDEIGVMSMGFFKTQTPLRNPELIEKIYRRLIQAVDTVEDITLVSILKILRYSSKLPHVDVMAELHDRLAPQIGRLSILCCLHIALLGSDIQTCHDGTMELILERYLKDIDTARLKDMERICHVISLYNYESPKGLEKKLCAEILSRLKDKIPETIQYPRCFSNCVHFLSLCGFHDEDMINAVLDPKFIKHAYDTNVGAARDIFSLDAFVKINLRDTYKGNQLPEKYRRTMGRLRTHYIPERNSKFKLSTTDRILVEIKEAVDKMLRISTFKHILPHYERPDIVVCYDTVKKKAIPLSPSCPEDYIGAILTRNDMLGDLADDPNLVTIAVAVAGWNNAVRGKNKPTGSFQMKLNQLSLLGHKHCLVYWHEWRQMETNNDRQNLLKRKLAGICK